MGTKPIIGAGVSALALLAAQSASAADADMAKMSGALSVMYEQATKKEALQKMEAARSAANVAQSQRAQTAARADDIVIGRQPADDQTLYLGPITADGLVVIEAIASQDAADLALTIESMGGQHVSSAGRMVSAAFPAGRLLDLAKSPYLAFARPSLSSTDVGAVTSQGDRSMRTDVVRANTGLDGSKTLIGVLSDSFSCATVNDAGGPFTTQAQDIASGDIPEEIINLQDIAPEAPPPDEGCIDEGRGMAQLIHDVAPGASIAFHTAFLGQPDFAQGIVELAEVGSDVIVDDVIYFAEPMFQDGIIAQAADEVNRLGVPYYSSNGNRGRDAFETEYRPVPFDGSTFHDFDPGPGVDPLLNVTLDGSTQTNLTFNWDSPNFSVSGGDGAQNDIDVIMFDSAGNRVPDCFPGGVFQFPAGGLCQFQFTDGGVPFDGGAGGDAVELVSLVDFTGGADVGIGFETQAGDPAGFVKFVLFGGGFAASEYPIDAPSGFGHNNAAGAEGVGASGFFYTEEFIGDPQTVDLRGDAGEPQCVPACLNDFSSAGGTPILFDIEGNRLSSPVRRLKPGLTGPDGGNTTFFRVDTFRDDDDGDGEFTSFEDGEFPNFFGTSASAPHVAAVAALMIDGENSQIRKIRKKDGETRIRMCRPDDDEDDDDDDDDDRRDDGETRNVRPDKVRDKIDRGWLLGPCSRSEPEDVREAMRSTAQDMSIRADLTTGETIQVFDEVGPSG
ncbi:MAG: hypothetical protein AAFW81_12385, partial [Pseudomonadota bacterium]